MCVTAFTTSFKLIRPRIALPFLIALRTLRMMSCARRLSPTTSVRISCSCSGSSLPCSMYCIAAVALFTIAASGWFNSCAREAVISPSKLTRPRSSTCSRRRRASCSAALRAVMSINDARTNTPRVVRIGLSPTSTGNSLPSFRRPKRSRPTPIARPLGCERKSLR